MAIIPIIGAILSIAALSLFAIRENRLTGRLIRASILNNRSSLWAHKAAASYRTGDIDTGNYQYRVAIRLAEKADAV